MGVMDINNSGFDAEQARYDRMNRTNPAEFAPGQNGVFNNTSVFPDSSVPSNTTQTGDAFSSPFGAFNTPDASGQQQVGGFGQASPFGGIPASPVAQPFGNQSQQPPQKSAEDIAFDMAKSAGKKSLEVGKDLGSSFSSLTIRWYSEWGRLTFLAGLGVSGLGLLLQILGYSKGLQIAIGAWASSAVGIIMWFFLLDGAKRCSSKYKDDNQESSSQAEPVSPPPAVQSFDSPSGFDSFSGFGGDATPTETIDFSAYADDDDDEDGYYEDVSEDTTAEVQEGMDTDEALTSLPEVPRGMYERNYLWEMFTKVLPTMYPDFADMKEFTENDDAFLRWEEMLREAATVAGCKDDFLPNLLELKENLFTIVVTCDRPTGFKPDVVAVELANIYAYDDNGQKNEGVFAKTDLIGVRCIITIFNGISAMISLKDMMLKEKAFILNTKNYLPIILGVDQLGTVITADMKKLESILVTGMPRSGKSWMVQALLTQMCAFAPPTDLHIYIGDPKEGISDYKKFTLPHVKKFVTTDDGIVAMLRNLAKVEAPRRKKIIGDAGFVNIWDYKEENPDVNMPLIYVVIDEVVTLASRMDKDTKTEFQMLLRELISQLPALGIRAFLIPHVINNDIIEKKTTDLISCRISVRGNADHIEKATGSKPKEFPYKLSNVGDMAVRLSDRPNTMFVHGAALTDSNTKNNKLFDYLRRVWAKLEPDEVSSISLSAERDESVNGLIQEANSSTLGMSNYDTGFSDDTDLLAKANDDSDLDDFSLF